ncbi:ABC transporter substrate-binding protein [Spirilliplanes yamanashiensis]|uniref:Peptide ABC transporter substrate-binding protein n=1 Tax=Spirilliplanes yamanashiensis TaxID=42233 RepID=A0A8J3YAX1_9ACTN|nr:ABC transporter substrate-binding protein [Spirilliplanes yamanashiensis]MDP9818872.1 peptide/nickel transport system substrate-binding protein [Spirilliplanes yamanashiensis]GIJ05326.1 peptide ABC transporter substrate-binding protein [Spirilliplanes yamanashiensis]
MRTPRLLALSVAGVLAAGTLAACSDSPNNPNANQGEAATVLNIGMPNGPQTENHNPFLGTSSASSLGYKWMIYEPLMMWNPVKPADPAKPWLGTKAEWSADYKTVKVTVRDGATWSDGKPLTAEDVAFTFNLIKNDKALNTGNTPYGDITASGSDVTIKFGEPQFVNQNKVLQQPIVPKHIWETIKSPSTDVNKTPVGSGPYTLKSFTPQTTTLVARTSGYWGTQPAVKELRYTSYTDNNAQTTALANGESEWSFVFIPNVQQVFVGKNPTHHKIWSPPVLGIHGLYINTTKKPFDDAVVRRAMDMVINRDDIFVQASSSYFHPVVKSVTGLPTPAAEAYIAPEYKGKEHKVDVEGAKKLLTDAGYKLEGNVLKDKSGKDVKITLTDPAGWSDYQTSLEIVKDNLSQIGIAATVDKANQDAWFKNVEEGKFDATFRWTNGGATPYDLYQTIMDGTFLKPIGQASPAGNFGRFDSPEATKALKDYANASDDATRTTALNTLQKIFVEQMPMIPVGADNVGAAYNVKNWVGWPDDSNPYGAGQPTQANSLDVVLHLKPANA